MLYSFAGSIVYCSIDKIIIIIIIIKTFINENAYYIYIYIFHKALNTK